MDLKKVFLFLLNNSITAGWVILAFIALRLLLRRSMPPYTDVPPHLVRWA